MQAKKLIGCIPVLLLSLLLCVLAIFLGGNLLGRAQEPDFIRVRINTPEQIAVNEPFAMQIIIQNVAPEEILLHSIDISNPYLETITLTNISPVPTQERNIPIVDFSSYQFEQTIPAGGTQIVTLDFIGKESGDFSGEFDVCVEASVICKLMLVETKIGQ